MKGGHIMTTLALAQRELHTLNGVTFYYGPRASDYDRMLDPTLYNPFRERERRLAKCTLRGRVTAALDMPLFIYRVYPDGHEKAIGIPLRVQTPRGKGTIWQSFDRVRLAVLLDSDMEHVTFFHGEEIELVEPIYERIYETPVFAAWLAVQ
jgi:hypothetical protein